MISMGRRIQEAHIDINVEFEKHFHLLGGFP